MTLYVLTRTHNRPSVAVVLGIYTTSEAALMRAERDMAEQGHVPGEDWQAYDIHNGQYRIADRTVTFRDATFPAGTLTIDASRQMWTRSTTGHAAGCTYAVTTYEADTDYDYRGT